MNGGWRPFSRLLRVLPRGVDPALTKRVLEKVAKHLWPRSLAGVSPNVLAEVTETLAKFPDSPDAVFALTGLELSDDPEGELTDWLSQQGLMDSFSYGKRRTALERQLATPAIIAAAQAAFAVTPPSRWWESPHVALLAADASPDSLDILTPLLMELRKRSDTDLDRFRTYVVPLIGDTAGGRALKQSFEDAVEARTEKSPARAFCVAIGLDPPPTKLVFRARYFAPGGEATWQLNADSTRADWFTIRPRDGWGWRRLSDPLRELASTLDGQRARVTLRVSSKDLDRSKLQGWLETFLT